MADTESCLISAVLRSGEIKAALNRGIGPEHFVGHPEEWEWILERHRVTRNVPSKTDFKRHFPNFGLRVADDAALYADRLAEEHGHRILTTTLAKVMDGQDAGKPLGRILDELNTGAKEVARVTAQRATAARRLSDWKDFLAETRRRQTLAETQGSVGIPYGFHTLDEVTGGMTPGQLIIWAARPSVGKSWMLHKMATSAVLSGKRVLLFSLEMNHFSVKSRMVGLLSRETHGAAFDPNSLRSGKIARPILKELASYLRSMNLPGDMQVYDQSQGAVSLYAIEAAVEAWRPDIVMVDYLQLLSRLVGSSGGDIWQVVAQVSAVLKQIGERYQIPVVTASQLNRAGESQHSPPTLAALALSDSPGQDADVVITMVPPTRNTLKCRVAKNREGPDGDTFWIAKQPGEGRIEEITEEEAKDLAEEEVLH